MCKKYVLIIPKRGYKRVRRRQRTKSGRKVVVVGITTDMTIL